MQRGIAAAEALVSFVFSVVGTASGKGTTKYTNHTNNEHLASGALLAPPVTALLPVILRSFVSFVFFVVGTAFCFLFLHVLVRGPLVRGQ